MAWFRGDDKSHQNPKHLSVGLLGSGLYWRMVSWSSDHETDGEIPAHVVPTLSPELSPKKRCDLLQSMVDAVYGNSAYGMLEVKQKGPKGEALTYLIHDYLVYNPSRSQLETKRETERQRVADRRTPK